MEKNLGILVTQGNEVKWHNSDKNSQVAYELTYIRNLKANHTDSKYSMIAGGYRIVGLVKGAISSS